MRPQPDIRLASGLSWNTSMYFGSTETTSIRSAGYRSSVSIASSYGSWSFSLMEQSMLSRNTADKLGVVAVPPLHEINRDPEFEGTLITEEEFEALWLEHSHLVKQ